VTWVDSILEEDDMRLQDFEQVLESAHQEIMQPVCPGPASETVGGFPRYQNTVASLSRTEQEKVKKIAGLIVSSVRLGCPSIVTVQLIGHADFDPGRERREPGFMHKISFQRALAVKAALERLIANPAISARVAWSASGVAATRLAVLNPRNEQERRLNRRVEVLFRTINPVCLKQALGTSIALHRPIAPEKRMAIRGFQQRHGLPASGIMTSQTLAALVTRCGFPQIKGRVAVKMRSDLLCTPSGPMPGPDRWVGQSSDNIQNDVGNTMDRLHTLWGMTNAEYNLEHPRVVQFTPPGGNLPEAMIPLTIAAIRRNLDPLLPAPVAQHYLNLALLGSVGRNGQNFNLDVLKVQGVLHARGFLSALDFTRENSAVRAFANIPPVPANIFPATLVAMTHLKDAIAGGRLGWAPIRADEAEHGGDRFGGRTFDFSISSLCLIPRHQPATESFGVSIFVPIGATPGVNKVHLFFSPGGVTGDSGFNAVLMHGLRAAGDASDWILIGIPGVTGGWRTIDLAGISACLAKVDRSTAIHALRLSGHSRGASGLRESVRRGFLRAAIDRIVILDASDAFQRISLPNALKEGKTSAGSIIHYGVNLPNLSGATNIRLDPLCMRAIGYTRLIQDATVTKSSLAIPPAISSQLLPLPARGMFTTSATPGAGRVPFQRFCDLYPRKIRTSIKQELDPRVGLLSFIERNDLTRFCSGFIPGIYSHHLFVAEMAHELSG
jgi:outer membrane protein OmpA-like peptidoglycan-associated protein